MDTKQEKAIAIISSEIAKIPANTIMDYGTLGYINGMTKREGAAQQMAAQFAKMMGYTDTRDAKRNALVNEIAAAAVAKVGK